MPFTQEEYLVAQEEYLGDGVYICHDGYSVRLRAPREDGDSVVYLEPLTSIALVLYINNLDAKLKGE